MATHFGLSHRDFAIAALLGLAAWAPAGYAATFTVGTGPNCTHGTIAAAVATSETSAGADTIRVTRSTAYTQQAIVFNVTQEVTITGGFADCDTNLEDASYTTLDGSGGSQSTVMTINGGPSSIVHLRKLTITGGDAAITSILGGGIYYTGNGLLDIADSSISNNTGAYGGGINVNGTGDAAELDIGPNTTLFGNTAYYNGGGIFSNNIETAIRGDNILIDFNTATGVLIGGNPSAGYGGGIHIRACILPSIVYLGSSGVGALGVVYNNGARYGGGIAIEGGDGCDHNKTAELRMYSINPTRLTKIQSNDAIVSGGGIYLKPSQTVTNAFVWDASIEGNTAPEASAAYLGTADTRALLYFNQPASAAAPPKPDGAVDCAIGAPCGRISGNGVAGSGHVIYGNDHNYLNADRVEISGNKGSELIHVEVTNFSNNLVIDNTVSARLIESNSSVVADSTIAGNAVGGSESIGISSGGHFSLLRSILWQPGKLALHNDGDYPTAQNVISNEANTLFGLSSFGVDINDPYFVDAVHGDYSLTAGSAAVDALTTDPIDNRDVLGHSRDVDLPIVQNHFGPRDLGALERQSSALVDNGDFDSNVNAWPEVTTGVSSWDATQNVAGPNGSGALHVSAPGNNVSVRKQCVHLPGPGLYALNGWGKSTGTIIHGSDVRLGWELRVSCTDIAKTSGSLLLANNSTWRRSASPALIAVNSTSDVGLVLYLVVEDGGGVGGQAKAPSATLNGWFDGITLDLLADRIFANGFQ